MFSRFRWFLSLAILFSLPLFGVEPSHHLLVPMTDGVKLVTDVYLPEDDGPFPTILSRSTYGRGFGWFESFHKAGYALVIQDVRGMGESEGEAHVFYADGWRPKLTDGADTVAWVLAQPWCNGKVGTVGGSALGITQMLLAPAAQGLSAQVVQVAPANFYPEFVYPGGVFRKNLLEGWLTAIKQPHIIDTFKSHPYYDQYWIDYNTLARVKDIAAPALFVNGWYDIFQQGTIDAFVEREKNGGEGAKGKNFLIMNWAAHGPDVTEDYALQENRFDLKTSKMRLQFLHYALRGDGGKPPFPKVHYYVMGDGLDPKGPGNEWRTADAWPPLPTQKRSYYLQADGGLDVVASGESKNRGFDFDPNDPYPTYGGGNLLMPSGPFDQSKESTSRKDLLKFASAPLEAPLEILGKVLVELHVSSDAPDTDFTAKLVDIYPEGDAREILMLDRIQRVKLRNGFDKPAAFLTGSDEVVRIEIDLWSISWILNKGHRIGLHVSSSNYPKFEVNPNTGADFPSEGEETPIAHNVVHMGGVYPSAIILPIRAD
jgi:uncharacterized protein